MPNNSDLVIIGAGPYGLSLAAHMRFNGINFRVIGEPMSVWRNHMPEGMFLKSDAFASNLSDPQSHFTLRYYCQQAGIPYHDIDIPVRLETFVDYADAFQRTRVPNLDRGEVIAVTQESEGFSIQLASGEEISATRVVVATGISGFPYTPSVLAQLKNERVSHSYAYGNVDRLQGKDVVVIGGGASAMDLTALLQERGATVKVIARARAVHFNERRRPGQRSVVQRLRRPDSGVGPSLQGWFYSRYPHVFYRFPSDVRVRIVKRFLGPAAGWTVKDRVLGRTPIFTGAHIAQATERNGCVRLRFSGDNTTIKETETEHIITATGYRVDLKRLNFLSENIRSQIITCGDSPALSANFQSSVPGLYFVGLAAANSFGPALRFAFGAEFASRTITRHLLHVLRHRNHYAVDRREESLL